MSKGELSIIPHHHYIEPYCSTLTPDIKPVKVNAQTHGHVQESNS